MNMYANGKGAGTAEMEDEWETHEATHYSNPEMEDEWETHEATHYSNPYSNPEMEDEWETHEAAHYSNPYSNPEMEDEWETHEATHYSNPEMEDEWETHEAAHYSNPYSNPEMEDEWEAHEATHYSNPYSNPEMEDEWETHEAAHYSNPEMEADQFLPFIPLIAKVGAMAAKKFLPKVGKALFKKVKSRLIPRGQRMVSNVVRDIQRQRLGRGGQPQQSSSPSRLYTARVLVERLRNVLSEGESEAAALEAQLFGANEFEGELAAHEMAHEAALTEVLAAEAAHTESESEAEALLGAALPITIRIMGGRRSLRPVMPDLVQANARLVRSFYRHGSDGRQLMRLGSAIHRRTITSLRAAQRAGYSITPPLISRVMAAQAARVLGTPRISGPALLRNFAIRRGTVAPAGRSIQMRRPVGY